MAFGLGFCIIVFTVFMGWLLQDEIENVFGKVVLSLLGGVMGIIVGCIVWCLLVLTFADTHNVTERYKYNSYYEGKSNWIVVDSADNVLEIDKDEVSFIDGVDSVYYKVYETPVDTTYPRMESNVKWIISK